MSTKFTLEFACDNAAFGETDAERSDEIAAILRTLAARIERGVSERSVRDTNGNKIGTWELSK